MLAPDGKMRSTDVADTEQLFRLIQSIPALAALPHSWEFFRELIVDSWELRDSLISLELIVYRLRFTV